MLNHKIASLVLCLLSSWAMASRCEIWEDTLRISHVKALDDAGATYCFGYLHGRDRAWMMDHFRRTALGTNAEAHGFSHLKGDMMMRLLDIPRWADKLWESMDSSQKLFFKQYAAGVNHGFRLARQMTTKEFTLGHPLPETWKPQHTLMILLLQSFDQTRKTFFSEWEEARAQEKWGELTGQLFDPDGVPWDVTVLKPGEYPIRTSAHSSPKPIPLLVGKLWSEFPTPFGRESGSNNWAVSQALSISQRAIFANDPHLDLKTPMFWYWVHLQSPDNDVIGGSLPGVPFIATGANRYVSWGLTNAYLNTADAVVLDEKDQKELESFRPLVWVKWWFFKIPIFFKTFQRTKEGFPVLPLETKDSRPLVLKWSGFHITGKDLIALNQIMHTRSALEMETALAQVGVPAWNFVFADVKGKIGHRVIGKALKGTQKDAPGLRAGDLTQLRNPEFLAPHEMPHVFDPPRGYVATANNRHWPMDSQFYGGRGYTQGMRALKIEEKLLEGPQSIESFQRLQCDDEAVDARFLAPLLTKALEQASLSPEQIQWKQELGQWNFSTGLDCRVCPIYRRTLDLAFKKLLVWEIGFWRLGVQGHQEWLQVVIESFQQAFKELAGKTWGQVHLNPFAHLSGRRDWVFAPEIATRGDKHSVDPGTSHWVEERKIFEHTSGASERLIVHMTEVPEVWLSLPGLNARYDQKEGQNPWKAWGECQYQRAEWPVDFNQKKTEKVEIEL